MYSGDSRALYGKHECKSLETAAFIGRVQKFGLSISKWIVKTKTLAMFIAFGIQLNENIAQPQTQFSLSLVIHEVGIILI